MSASTARTCRRFKIGVGAHEDHVRFRVAIWPLSSRRRCSPSTAAPPRLNLDCTASDLCEPRCCSPARLNRSARKRAGFAQKTRGETPCLRVGFRPQPAGAVIRIGALLADTRMPAPAAIGHRVVHGGPRLRQHCLIDESVLQQLESATPFAPLHIPSALSLIRFAREHFPTVPQAACFDTTFHTGLADVARVLPVSKELQAEGIQRYGFHGLSCESIVRQLGDSLPSRVVIAHLGNGASVTAVKDGQSIDTSMGLTPTGG